MQEAENVMERLTALPWHELPIGQSQREVSLATRDMLPDSHVNVLIVDEPGDFPSKRLSVEVYWQGRPGQTIAPARLISWVFRGVGDVE
jgi:hypothetical protein